MKERPNGAAAAANFEFAALGEARNYRRALLKEFGPNLHGHVIEIGAGVGQITRMLLEIPAIKQLLSIEPDPGFFSELQRQFPGGQFLEGTIDKVGEDFGCDAIISINVLEHILEDDAELHKYRQLLRQRRGTLNLFVPACQEIHAPIDTDFGHHRRYSKPDLRRKLEKAGFEIERLRYFNIVGYFAWWAMFCVWKKRQFDVASIRFFDRLIFPWVYALESRVMAPPFGQSLVVVARARPEA